MAFKRMVERRAERKAAYPHEDEPEAVQAKEGSPADTDGYPDKPDDHLAAPLTPSPEPPVLPQWKDTVAAKIEDKTVGDWIIQGITKIVDEHKLISLTAWRDPAGNVVVQYVEDPRAMYALRKA